MAESCLKRNTVKTKLKGRSKRRLVFCSLHVASKEGFAGIVKRTSRVPNINVNIVNYDNQTPLHVAAQNGQYAVFDILLSITKSNPYLYDDYGMTALHYASLEGHQAIVERLCQLPNMDVNHSALIHKNTALHFAAQCGHVKIIDILNNYSVNPNCSNAYGYTALLIAVRESKSDAVDRLLEINNLNPNICSNIAHASPLHMAIKNNDPVTTGILLTHPDININVQTLRKQTPLMLVSETGNINIAEMLVEMPNIDPNIQNEDGHTALHSAVTFAHEDIVRILAKIPTINPNIVDYEFKVSPLTMAINIGEAEIVNILSQIPSRPYIPWDTIVKMDIDSPLWKIHYLITQNMPLLMAAFKEDVESCQKLLAHSDHDGINMVVMLFCVFFASNFNTSQDLKILDILLSGCSQAFLENPHTSYIIFCLCNLAVCKLFVQRGFLHLASQVQYAFRGAIEANDEAKLQLVIDLWRKLDNVNVEFRDKTRRDQESFMNQWCPPHTTWKNPPHSLDFDDEVLRHAVDRKCTGKIVSLLADKIYRKSKREQMLRFYAYLMDTPLGSCTTNLVTKRDLYGQCALQIAVEHCIPEHIQTLVRYGADIQSCDRFNVSVLDITMKDSDIFKCIDFTRVKLPAKNMIHLSMLRRVYQRQAQIETKIRLVTDGKKCLKQPLLAFSRSVGLLRNTHHEKSLIKSTMTAILREAAKKMKSINPEFQFTPVLVGSSSEGARIAFPNEFDFLCVFSELGKYFETDPSVRGSSAHFKVKDQFSDRIAQIFHLHKYDAKAHTGIPADIYNHLASCISSLSQFCSGRNIVLPRKPIDMQPAGDIACMHVTWRGQYYRNLLITVDLVPAVPFHFSPPERRHIVPPDTRFYLITKTVLPLPFQGRNEFQVAFSDSEHYIIKHSPQNIKDGYKLAKLLRSTSFFPTEIIRSFGLSADIDLSDCLKSYMLKTSLFFLLEKELVARCSVLPRLSPMQCADKIYSQLETFLIHGKIPCFFTGNALKLFECVHASNEGETIGKECCAKRHFLLKVVAWIRFFISHIEASYTHACDSFSTHVAYTRVQLSRFLGIYGKSKDNKTQDCCASSVVNFSSLEADLNGPILVYHRSEGHCFDFLNVFYDSKAAHARFIVKIEDILHQI